MKKGMLFIIVLVFSLHGFSQKLEGIYFHLYTDSLKKGQHNYINVDGKYNNDKWLPLTAKEIIFSSNYGTWEGNELIIPPDFKQEKVTVKAVLKSDTSLSKEITIWIKKIPDPDRLPTQEEILKKEKTKKKND